MESSEKQWDMRYIQEAIYTHIHFTGTHTDEYIMCMIYIMCEYITFKCAECLICC